MLLRRFVPLAAIGSAALFASCDCSGPAVGEGEGEGEVNPPGAPATTIVAPADGAFILAGATTTFSCTAIDELDGLIPNASIAWRASIEGDLGVGATVQTALVSLGDQEITCVAVDSDGIVGTDSVVVHVVTSLPPAVTITAPAEGAFFGAAQSITFQGRAVDANGAPIGNASLVWLDGGGQIGIGAAVTTILPLGDHLVALEATDAAGAVGRAEVTVHVVDNVPPQCSILSPSDGATLAAGQSVQFSTTCSNPDGGAVQNAAVRWASSVDGVIGTGFTVTNALSTRGAHTITVCATDPDDAALEGCDSISLTVGDNASPIVNLIAPNAGGSFQACRDVALECSAVDPEGQGVTIRWTDSAGAAIPAGGFVDWRPTSGGTHTLTCTATDAQGASSSASVVVIIESPTARIQGPGDGDNFNLGETIDFRGEGCDAALGSLFGAQLVWSSNRDGVFGTGQQLSTSSLSTGNHVITLMASNGAQSGVDSIQIDIQ